MTSDDDLRAVREEMDELRCMLYSEYHFALYMIAADGQSMAERTSTFPTVADTRYYWGSINTHRYTIWRHARKMRGRCFAVNYRSTPLLSELWTRLTSTEAPQYPFPCAIQDCLAAYLYLVNPPPGANHSPVDPKKLVIAGDSAGGGLVLALLQILRDTEGLTLPAGAILISPVSHMVCTTYRRSR